MRILSILLFTSMVLCGFCQKAYADPPEVLRDKQLVDAGECVFKDGVFQLFGERIVPSPDKKFVLVDCLVFVENRTMNPAWLVLTDDQSNILEIIKWTDPATFETVYKLLKGGI